MDYIFKIIFGDKFINIILKVEYFLGIIQKKETFN